MPSGSVAINDEADLMRIARLQIALFILLSLAGCTAQAWYEGVKMGAENECNKQPPGATSDCLSRLNKKSHAQYEKERQSK
jgi:hypothetical protein